MRALLVIAAAACLLAGAIAMEAPAALIDQQIAEITHGRLRVGDAAGTIWNGSGTLILLPYNARVPVRWHIDALPLLRMRLTGTLARDSLQGAAESAPATFDLSAEDFAVNRLAVAFPAEALLRAADAPAFITGAGGTVDLRADAFARRRGSFDGGFVATWRGASVPGPRPDVRVALGDVRVDGVGSGSEIKGALSNAGGDIEITGTMSVAAAGATRVDARLKPRVGIDAERSSAINSALSLVAAKDDSGAYRIAWQGAVR